MTHNLDSLPERLLASVIGLDELIERELFGWEILDDSTARLRATKSLLCAAFSPDSFSGSYGESFESPVALSVEASDINLESIESTRRIAPGWERWLYWWQQYEEALAYRVLDLVAGIPGTLRDRFEASGPVIRPLSSSPARRLGGFTASGSEPPRGGLD